MYINEFQYMFECVPPLNPSDCHKCFHGINEVFGVKRGTKTDTGLPFTLVPQ